MQAQISRHARVGDGDVAIFDDLVPAESLPQYVTALDRAAFTHTEMARPETAEYRHWVTQMPLPNLLRTALWQATEAALATMRPDRRYRPYRAYTNYAAFGDMLFSHTDCQPGQDELTAMWFLSREWDAEWGGETLFFNADGDAEVVVSPRPGRLVIFDGAIRHVGRPPNRICFTPRYTFAIKLERDPARPASE